MPSNFKDSQEAAFRRIVRNAIRKGPFTKGERDVTLALVNHWFHHRAKGKMHPGRTKIAKRAGVTVKTVSRAMAKLRAAGILVAMTPLKGNRHKATEYTLNERAILVFCGCDWLDRVRYDVPSRALKMSHLPRDKMSHRIYNVQSPLSQNGKLGGNEDV